MALYAFTNRILNLEKGRIIMKKRLLAMFAVVTVTASMLAGCSDNRKTTDTETTTEAVSTEETTESTKISDEAAQETSETAAAEGEYTIGISQFAEHGSLDNCREGFLAGLAEEGIVEGENLTVEFQNAEADTGIASQISDSFVSAGVDLICAIATPSAMSAYNSAMDTDIPVIYTAVSDPISAELADSAGMPVGNITGTSDALAVTEQLEMIRSILPDAKTIGIIYTTSETNSVSTIAQYEQYAEEYGFEIVKTGINTLADLDMAASDMASKVDCINNLTDNTVVSGLQTVIKYANEAGIPVFGSEVEQVKAGCVAAMGLDYYQLGVQTGKMAAAVLKGESSASEMPFEVIDEPSLYLNTAAAENIGLELPEDMLGSAEIYDTITVE